VREDITRGWNELDRSVLPVEAWQGGAHAGLKRLRHFVEKILRDYEETRNKPELDGTSCL
jgi:deoxyribodipyrimidine photo-lyase